MSDVLNAERARYLIGLIGNTCMAEPDTAAVASSALSELGEIFADAEARVVAAERERDAAVEAGKEALLAQVPEYEALAAAVRAGGNADALATSLTYVLNNYAPADECEGPRDCVGTDRGCRHCSPNVNIDRAYDALRTYAARSVGVTAPEEPAGNEPPRNTHVYDGFGQNVGGVSRPTGGISVTAPEEEA